jgi:hypothetical protein
MKILKCLSLCLIASQTNLMTIKRIYRKKFCEFGPRGKRKMEEKKKERKGKKNEWNFVS